MPHFHPLRTPTPRPLHVTPRAACRLKLGKAEAALQDAGAVLEQAPDNVKALFRAGQARAALKVREREWEGVEGLGTYGWCGRG